MESSPHWDRLLSSLGSDTLTTVTPAPVVNRSDYFTFLSAGLPALNYTTALFDEPDRDSNEEWPESEDEDDKDRKSTRLNSSHVAISYAVFCLKKKKRET